MEFCEKDIMNGNIFGNSFAEGPKKTFEVGPLDSQRTQARQESADYRVQMEQKRWPVDYFPAVNIR